MRRVVENVAGLVVIVGVFFAYHWFRRRGGARQGLRRGPRPRRR